MNGRSGRFKGGKVKSRKFQEHFAALEPVFNRYQRQSLKFSSHEFRVLTVDIAGDRQLPGDNTHSVPLLILVCPSGFLSVSLSNRASAAARPRGGGVG
jgi:hypothetical protein